MNNKKKLSEILPGQKSIVKEINCSGFIKRRLIDMGITPGTNIIVKKIAPLGDPIELYLRGYNLSIRKEDAKNIIVE